MIILLASLSILASVRPPSASAAAFDAHGGPVKSVAISADGRTALTASFDYSIIFWDLESETIKAELEGHQAAVNAVTFLPGDDQALSASDDGLVLLWDLQDGTLRTRFEGHGGKVVAVAVSPDGRMGASAGWDRTVRLWDLRGATSEEAISPAVVLPVSVLKGRDNMNAVRFSQGGRTVIAGSSDGDMLVWRVEDGVQIAGIGSHDFAVTGLDHHEDGMVATSSVDETVRLWDLDERAPLQTLYGHEGPVLSVDLSADGELVASGGVDGTVRVWRRGDGDRLKVYARHRGPVWSVVFAPDDRTLLSGGADGLVLTYDLDEAAEPAPLAEVAPENGVVDLGQSPLSRGEKLFRTCSACHTTTPDDGHRAGPTLHGLFGRVAGSHPDYRYSEALETSDLVWTEETVDQLFEIGPDHLLPGTKMPLQRMPSDQDRADLIAFLKKATRP